jgi:O-antigen/teichoic acid export membrane protein
LGALWRVSRRASWGVGAVAVGLLVASPWLLPSVYRDTALLLLVLAAASIPLQIETLLGGGLLTMAGQVMVQFRGALVAVALQGVLLVALWAGPGLTPALVLATTLVGALVTWGVVFAHCRRFPAEEVPSGWPRVVLGSSLPLHVSAMLLWMHLRVDMFMVSALSGAAMLGLYSLAVVLAETVQLATDSLGTALMPRQAVGSLEDAARLGLLGARASTIVGSLGAAGWLATASLVVPFVFGEAFRDAVVPLLVLLPGMVALGLQRACGAAIVRAGRPWRLASIHAGSLAINTALNLWWIPLYGPAGAAAASTVSYGASAAAIVVWTASVAEARLAEAVPRWADVALLWRGVARAAGLGH